MSESRSQARQACRCSPVNNLAEAASRKNEAGAVVPLKILRNGRTKLVIVKN